MKWNHILKRIFLIFLFFLIGTILTFSYASSPHVSGSNIHILIYEDSGLGFQSGTKEFLLTPTTGNLNSSTNSILVHKDGGVFRFLSNETFTLQITFDVNLAKIRGDKGNSQRPFDSGSSFEIDSGDIVTLEWDILLEPWLPIMFIFGMFGLLSIFGGSIWSARELRKGHYEEALVNGIIFVTVGITLVLAWLWC